MEYRSFTPLLPLLQASLGSKLESKPTPLNISNTSLVWIEKDSDEEVIMQRSAFPRTLFRDTRRAGKCQRQSHAHRHLPPKNKHCRLQRPCKFIRHRIRCLLCGFSHKLSSDVLVPAHAAVSVVVETTRFTLMANSVAVNFCRRNVIQSERETILNCRVNV